MRGYGQFCPVAKASEVFAERWTPLILRELLMGSRRFSDLERGVPRISKSLLAQRLVSLEQAGLIERRASPRGRGWEYVPTQAGQELYDVIELLGVWGARWVNHDIGLDDADPDLLVWDMHRRINVDLLPPNRTVVRIDFTGMHTRSYWLVLDRDDVSVCFSDPGFDADLLVTADSIALHRIWIGHRSFSDALRSREVRIDGPRELARAFPTWLQLSMFSHVAPAGGAHRQHGARATPSTPAGQ
jgi:DNA-binding HxlR family transcriptional regulator